ncbi:MAG TPA: class I SAM-dependent methyltransferase [Burkholderiales bacterium]|nr:class I SAM-dependent methyltransferase [Burkholderiales bacterium]
MSKVGLCLLVGLALAAAAVQAQERFSPFVPSDQENVERMLKLARLKDDDVVVDLGSGDGRIVLTAARMNPRLRGWGVDIDEELVLQSNAAALAQGVADRVQFFHRNAFDADLREATVIAMWLWPELQRLLRPVILARARPGTRVVTNLWDLGSWLPDEEDLEPERVAMWIVPARVAGNWSWELTLGGQRVPYGAVMEQRFQAVEGVVRAGSRRELLHDVKLRGEDLSFSLMMTIEKLGFVRHEFRGKVRGDAIEGTAIVSLPPHEQTVKLPWRARLGATSAYFEPTGTDVR